MNKYRWLPEVFDHLDDIHRYAEFADLDELKDLIHKAREVTLREVRNRKLSETIKRPDPVDCISGRSHNRPLQTASHARNDSRGRLKATSAPLS